MIRKTALALSLVVAAFVTACTPTTDPVPTPSDEPDIVPTNEVEPNNTFGQATPVTLSDLGRARLAGQLPPPAQAADTGDFYSLGPVKAGDRITVSVDTLGSELVPVVAVFDGQKRLFILKSGEGRPADAADPFIDEVFRHDSEGCYLVATRALTQPLTSGSYEVVVGVQRGGTVPPSRRQTVLLDFNGGTVTVRDGRTLTVGPFDSADIAAAYAGETDAVKRRIVETFRQNYARFDVVVRNTDENTPPPESPFSTVYFGGYDPEGLGIALNGVDPYNHDPSDDAIVFTERFTPDLFTNSPTAEQLGVAIGNIAAHEAGHLLGLNHVHDATAIMNTYDAPDNLLTDQRFGQESIDNAALPIFFADLEQEQDDILLLSETVGRAGSAADSTVAVGQEPSCVTVADLTGDGPPDLLVANTLSSEVSFLRNEGGGTFTADQSFFTGWGPASLVTADFNGEGTLEFAVANSVSNSIAILRRNASGNFVGLMELSVQDGPRAVIAADLDGDGHVDLATANTFGKTASVLRNKGDGAFESEVIVPAGPFPMSIAAGDLNGDGRLDLVVANSDTMDALGGVVVLLQDQEGRFTGQSVFTEMSVPSSAAVADVNGDGRPDIIITDLLFNVAYVLLNQGDATFAEPVRYVVGDTPLHVAVADVNGDGHPDMIVANSDSNDVSVLLNEGDGAFAAEWPYAVGAGPNYVVAADLNGDGAIDLAVANEADETVSILLNRGDGTFGMPGAGP